MGPQVAERVAEVGTAEEVAQRWAQAWPGASVVRVSARHGDVDPVLSRSRGALELWAADAVFRAFGDTTCFLALARPLETLPLSSIALDHSSFKTLLGTLSNTQSNSNVVPLPRPF